MRLSTRIRKEVDLYGRSLRRLSSRITAWKPGLALEPQDQAHLSGELADPPPAHERRHAERQDLHTLSAHNEQAPKSTVDIVLEVCSKKRAIPTFVTYLQNYIIFLSSPFRPLRKRPELLVTSTFSAACACDLKMYSYFLTIINGRLLLFK